MRYVRLVKFLAICLLLMVWPVVSGCGSDSSEAHESDTVVVRTETLALIDESGTVEVVGSLYSAQEAVIASKVMGTVTDIHKNAGDPVVRGEVLIEIDSRDVAGQITQAEGALAQAKAAAVLAEANYQRFEQLHDRGSASNMELDQARYQYETARGAVRQAEGAVSTARSYKSYAEIPAPFEGRVVDRFCEVGDLASPGRPLMKIEDPARLRLHASLEATKASAAQPGAAVTVQVPALGTRDFSGTVREVVPAADPATHSFLVKIDLEPDPVLRAGLYGRALLPLGQRSALRVPRTAVVKRGGVTGVFVAESGRAVFRLVTLADSHDPAPEVLSGLSEGDHVIVHPPAALEVGSRIEVTR
jgi:RND family efflux transporter MFP subunit